MNEVYADTLKIGTLSIMLRQP